MMSILRSSAAFLFILAGSTPLSAQAPTTMVAGSVIGALKHGNQVWCAVDRGAAFFERNGNANIARITLPDVTYATISGGFPPTTYYTQPGQARLIFSSATAGSVLFDVSTYPEPIRRPPFAAYSQTYDLTGRLLKVLFTIQFPKCSLRIVSSYRN